MTWTSPRTWVAGETVTAALLNTHVRDNLLDLAGTTSAWAAYTPTWTGSTTNPVLNNGTLTGRWKQSGKTVKFAIVLTVGSTTTFGSGFWLFSLPATVGSSDTVVPVWCNDASAASFNRGVSRLTAGSATAARSYVADGVAATAILSPTAPFTWATSDVLEMSGVFEAA